MYNLIAAGLLALAAVHAAPSSGLTFAGPPAWKTRPAASTMRVAEFVVPKAAGDAEDAELIVYFFGSVFGAVAGGVEANVDRWIGQMQQPDGSASKDKVRRETQTINGLKVTTVDLAGTYIAEVRPGATERYNKPGFRLRAAVVETPGGNYFVKMTGPAKTMAGADADFKKFMASVSYK
jgi:hypothetical protein